MTGGIRPGDWGVIVLSAAAVLLVWAVRPAGGDQVLIQRDGQPFFSGSLRLDRVVSVPGPLGETRVEIRAGRVRVQSDPSPRQVCVRQGWLRAGQSAVCLPNRVSVELGAAAYDSLNY